MLSGLKTFPDSCVITKPEHSPHMRPLRAKCPYYSRAALSDATGIRMFQAAEHYDFGFVARRLMN